MSVLITTTSQHQVDLLSILWKSLALAADDNSGDHSWNHEKQPGLAEWSYFDIAIAIGYFDEEYGRCKVYYHNFKTGATCAPNGHDVVLRRVYSDLESACSNYVVTEAVKHEVESDCMA
jgi:hypothetical protein